MKKKDIIFAAFSGLGVAWLASGMLKDFGVTIKFIDPALYVVLPLLAILGIWICYLIGKKFLFVFQAAKFLLTGVLASLLDIIIFRSSFKILEPIILNAKFNNTTSKTVSFLIVTFAKYWANKFWAFESKEKEGRGKEMLNFYLVTTLGLLINVGAFSFLVNVMETPAGIPVDTWKTIALIMSALVVSVWNFLGYKFIVFKK